MRSSSGALIGVVFLCIAGILGLRELAWWRSQETLRTGVQTTWRVRLAEPVRETISNCIIMVHGQTVLVKQDMCRISHLQAAEVGDEMVVTGSWKARMTEDGKPNNGWIVAENIKVYRIEPTWGVSYWWWLRNMVQLRSKIVLIYKSFLPEPQSSLVAGIVVGEQASLPPDFKQALQRTGTLHMVAASGYNVAVVAGVVMSSMVSWMGRKKGVLVTGCLVWLYVMLAGGSPPVVRAGLMGIIMLVGVMFGMEYWAGWGLLVVTGLMLIWQPELIASVSFQLSVAATAGVIWGAKPMGEAISSLARWLGSRVARYEENKKPLLFRIWKQAGGVLFESLATTFAAVVMTAPVSLITFGEVSWWGLVVNPLVLWLVPPLMSLGSWMAVSGLIWFPLASVSQWLIAPLAFLMVRIIEVTNTVPLGLMTMPMNWWLAAGWWLVWLGIWGTIHTHTRYS